MYDKSLFHGQGDRSAKGVTVRGPVDVVIFEGWMNGFGALPDEELAARYAAASSPSAEDTPSTLVKYSKATLDDINERLRDYEDVWNAIDCFVQIRPLDMLFVWEWSLQVMEVWECLIEEVRQFIDRYMPSYELFQDGIDKESTTWHGKGLRFRVDSHRNIVKVEKF
ncbi:hypothetical protein L198_02407 [Cryptococcus wingfieldii CBS 7118]|uniref:Uncharacterized protein n=1 Tax=Cryptococcus wingfieldii CBS 7118 TaxID=1295528 RepID=A0A1E3JRQ3_9TREE|nr:hypothetical protein L198_02407 [Cryptococcus wingfieldii CBS 7118]ODO03559.1 hypothetical protein L198_02407 [Cryptococcus wingfieldii CBS 7118]